MQPGKKTEQSQAEVRRMSSSFSLCVSIRCLLTIEAQTFELSDVRRILISEGPFLNPDFAPKVVPPEWASPVAVPCPTAFGAAYAHGVGAM